MNEYEVVERGGEEYPSAMAALEAHPLRLAWLREVVRRCWRRLVAEGRLVEVGGHVEVVDEALDPALGPLAPGQRVKDKAEAEVEVAV